MNPGGRDLTFQTSRPQAAMRVCLNIIREHWPRSVVQDADSEDIHPIDDEHVWSKLVTSKHLLVFPDAATAASWDIGADQSSMISLIRGDNSLTAVIGPEDIGRDISFSLWNPTHEQTPLR